MFLRRVTGGHFIGIDRLIHRMHPSRETDDPVHIVAEPDVAPTEGEEVKQITPRRVIRSLSLLP